MSDGISSVFGSSLNTQAPANTNSKSDVSKDEFLTLLTYQLKNQNPLKPYDTQEFSSTLAQFSQLEQLTELRSLMEDQLEMNSLLGRTMTNSALPGMLGKSATAYSNEVYFSGDDSVSLGYDLPYPAAQGKVKIYDENNVLVNIIELDGKYLESGVHAIEWNGRDFDGDSVAQGKYRFEAEMTESNGAGFSADTFTKGAIEAVRFKSDGTFLVIGGIEVSLNRVSDISQS